MTTEILPPIRTAKTLQWFGGTWSYDTWGSAARPVLFLHSVLFDRTMWWPVAAELHRRCTPIAVDLPGHGGSPARDAYDPEVLVDELAVIVYGQRIVRSPIVVGHGASAGIANLYAKRFPTRAIVLVDPHLGDPSRVTADRRAVRTGGVDGLLGEMKPAEVPSPFRPFAEPVRDSALLLAYRECVEADPWDGVASDAPMAAANGRTSRLAVYSQTQGDLGHLLRTVNGNWRHSVYGTPGRFPHLTDVDRFADDIRSLL